MLFSSLFALFPLLPATLAVTASIAPYNSDTAASHASAPGGLSESTVVALLNVLKQYSLETEYAVYSLHSHLTYSSGQAEAAYTTPQDATHALTALVSYASIEGSAAPSVYAIDTAAGQLLPLEFTPNSEVPRGAQQALEGALSTGLLTTFASVLSELSADEQQAAGLALLTPLTQAALSDESKVIVVHRVANSRNQPNTEENTKLASLVDKGEAPEGMEPTLWVWGEEGPTAPAWCELCIWTN
ncbi:hypothetical protein CALCODRAFT_559056 [Calocera cornea HHB12733]|uniref:Uncharacterized protein n=1 Tax=Calocera cornea HHB12733 TaxID=1353952 RepID=A0A165CC16_9BASI|nr:hypothetical protein CALCODRAFT_559056 [Calocera cornea HHB12733]